MIKKLAVALVHYPVFDRAGKRVATNVTHFDIHDIARVCRVYGVDRYYIIHPAREQLMFVSRMLDHWRVGPGKHFNPMRKTALTMVEPVESLEVAIEDFKRLSGEPNNKLIATSAKDTYALDTQDNSVRGLGFKGACERKRDQLKAKNLLRQKLGFKKVRGILEKDHVLLVFGTGFGLFREVFEICDACLEPIRGYGERDYRHLSVRSAVGICLDRLRGSW